jgi:hypothetical protein
VHGVDVGAGVGDVFGIAGVVVKGCGGVGTQGRAVGNVAAGSEKNGGGKQEDKPVAVPALQCATQVGFLGPDSGLFACASGTLDMLGCCLRVW